MGKFSRAIIAGGSTYALDDVLKPGRSSFSGKVAKGAAIGLGVYLVEETLENYLSAHSARLESATSLFRDKSPEISTAIYRAGALLKEIPRELSENIDTPLGYVSLGLLIGALGAYAIHRKKIRRDKQQNIRA